MNDNPISDEKLRKTRDELETKVRERNKEVVKSNEILLGDWRLILSKRLRRMGELVENAVI